MGYYSASKKKFCHLQQDEWILKVCLLSEISQKEKKKQCSDIPYMGNLKNKLNS